MGNLSFAYLADGSHQGETSAKAASVIQRKELSASGLLCNIFLQCLFLPAFNNARLVA